MPARRVKACSINTTPNQFQTSYLVSGSPIDESEPLIRFCIITACGGASTCWPRGLTPLCSKCVEPSPQKGQSPRPPPPTRALVLYYVCHYQAVGSLGCMPSHRSTQIKAQAMALTPPQSHRDRSKQAKNKGRSATPSSACPRCTWPPPAQCFEANNMQHSMQQRSPLSSNGSLISKHLTST